MLHALLMGQLKQLGLDPHMPLDARTWQALLVRISHSYTKVDGERSLALRSREASVV